MTSKREQTIDRLIDEVLRAEERGDMVSTEFLGRCLVSSVKASEEHAPSTPAER